MSTSHLLSQARQALAAGKLSEANRLCGEVLRSNPTSLGARFLISRARLGRWAAAKSAVRLAKAIEREPGSHRALLMMSVAQARLENRAEALDWARRASELAPHDIKSTYWRGRCSLEMAVFQEAEDAFQTVVDAFPKWPETYFLLGQTLLAQGYSPDATDAFTAACDLKPGIPRYRAALVGSLLAENDLSAALDNALRLVSLKPNEGTYHLLLAECLVADGRTAEAEIGARRAIELRPYDSMAIATLGSILMTLGQMDEARAESERSIQIEPKQGLAWFNLIRSRRITEPDRPLIERMSVIADDPKTPLAQQVLVRFGLGKALEDLADCESAMRHYDKANELDHRRKFGDAEFDAEANRAAHEAAKLRHNAETIPFDDDGPVPIFVIGMLRSGTTLLEQMLTAHSAVGGAGEQRFWMTHGAEPFETPETNFHDLRREYLQRLSTIAPGKEFVVDKMPTNYMNVGLLNLAFPRSPIIHIQRNPIDTCLSIYATYNRVPLPWANHKEHIATNYERYLDLMAHWRKILPENRILEVRYERLVAEAGAVLKPVIEACGLDWEDACVHPERSDHSITTPSVWQARQPIYATSIERWRRFEPWLGELTRLQDDACV